MGYIGDDFAESFESNFGFPVAATVNIPVDAFELEGGTGVILLESGSILLQET